MRRRWLSLAIAAAAVAAAAAGARATAPPDGLIHACAAPQTAPKPGELTLAAADGSCPSGDTPVAWATGGPPGATGPEGLDGADAAPGPAGAPGADGKDAYGTADRVGVITRDQMLSGSGAFDVGSPVGGCGDNFGYSFGNIDTTTYSTTQSNEYVVTSNSHTNYFSYEYMAGPNWAFVTDPAAAGVDGVPSHQTPLELTCIVW